MMNRLLFVFLLAAAGPTVDAFAAHLAKGQVHVPFRIEREESPLATFTKLSGRPRTEVSATKCNKQHHDPDISSIIKDARGAKRRKILKASTLGALGLLAVASRSTVANAARKTASAAVVPPILELPSTKTLALACLVPTLLGFYKSEYGVSYGYGTAMAASSYLVLSSLAAHAGLPLMPGIAEFTTKTFTVSALLESALATLANLQNLLPMSLPAFHAFALFFYGTRLDIFLAYRELFLKRFRAMRERIEDRAKKQGSRFSRTPFIISCAFLYFCMVTPVMITSQICRDLPLAFSPIKGGIVPLLEQSCRLSIVVSLFGFLLGAVGDLNKTIGKALKGEDELITGFVFRFFRHPNYTGEVIGWNASMLAAFLAVALKCASGGGGLTVWKTYAAKLALSVCGACGITFVLATATAGLEFRQQEKYGGTASYDEWVKKSWVGFKTSPKERIVEDDGTK